MKKIAAALAAAALCAGAQAATVSYDFTTALTKTDFTNQSGSLKLFDTSMGTLTGVSLSLRGFSTTDLTMTNTSNSLANASASSITKLSFTSSITELSNLIGTKKITLDPTTDDQDLAAHQTLSFNGVTDADSFNVLGLNGILSVFYKTANQNSFTIGCTSSTKLTTSTTGGNLDATQNTKADCGATVTYTYTASATPPTPTPEPASLALVGLGLAGVGAVRRKSKRA